MHFTRVLYNHPGFENPTEYEGGRNLSGVETVAVNRLNGSLAEDKLFSPGDRAFVVVSHAAGQITTVYMTDHFRLDKEAALAGLFVLLLLFARGTGRQAAGKPTWP